MASESQVSSTRSSSTDGLTGLPDRPAFAGRVAIALTEATAGRSELAVLLLDLDHYRSLRNSLGPAAGDALLGAVAGRLSATLRHGDVLGRLAEDEFAVLLLGVTDAQDAAVAAARLLAIFERPFQVAARQVLVRVSIGVASGGFGTPAASELLRDAEMAMLRAKAEGGDRWASFAPGMHAASLARFDLEHALGEAIATDQLTLEFQPMIALAGAHGRSGHIRRVEALVRWRHPQRGLIPPSDFIPLAEETGLIVELGAWVLRAAARQGRAWQQMAEQHAQLGVSVNISPRQLFHPICCARWARCWRRRAWRRARCCWRSPSTP